MNSLKVYPQTTPLRGSVSVPGDKSISHRALMLAALAGGTSHFRGWLPAGDTLATLQAVQELGATVQVVRQEPQAWELEVTGRGERGLQAPATTIDCHNAGTCMRLLAGILAGQPFPSILDGSAQLRRRPMGRITTPLRQMGADISDDNGRAPLIIHPAPLHGIRYTMPVASAQVKSALLLAGLFAKGDTCIFQPGPARDHTERMLAAMGVPLEEKNGWICLPQRAAGQALPPLHMDVPADISSAAFLLVAASLVPYSQLTVTGVGVNSSRTGILDLLQSMGAGIVQHQHRHSGGEPTASLTVQFEELHGTEIGGEVVVRAIDEFPILTVAATQAAGRTTVRDAAELRLKEVDRIAILAGELAKMGVTMVERPDGYSLEGPVRPRAARVDCHQDHRLGMALAILALLADGPSVVEQAGSIADSFPGFVETMQAVGAEMRWID